MPSLMMPEKSDTRTCTQCGKAFEREPLVVKDGDLCPDCRKTYAGMAFVYCMTCKAVVSRVEPGIASNGYLVKPGDLLHVKACPVCSPGIIESIPVEFTGNEKVRIH